MLLEYFTKRSDWGWGEGRGVGVGDAAFDINHSPLGCGYCHTLSSKERYTPLRVSCSSPSVPKKSISRRHHTPNTGCFLLTCSSSNREAHQREQALASMRLTLVTTEILAEVTFCKSPPRHFLAPVLPLHNLCLNKYFKETTSFSRHLAQRMLRRMYSPCGPTIISALTSSFSLWVDAHLQAQVFRDTKCHPFTELPETTFHFKFTA